MEKHCGVGRTPMRVSHDRHRSTVEVTREAARIATPSGWMIEANMATAIGTGRVIAEASVRLLRCAA